MKLLVLYFVLQAVLICQSRSPSISKLCKLNNYQEICLKVKINKIIDGETVEVYFKNISKVKTQKIHLYGLSSPPFNEERLILTKDHLSRLLRTRKTLTLVLKKERDDFGRSAGTLYSGNLDINKKMIKDGYAWCTRSMNCPKGYYNASQKAIQMKKGIWNQNHPKNSTKRMPKPSSNASKGVKYQVVLLKVVDGDTVNVRKTGSQDSKIIKVRMGGIDTPEMKQSFGVEARNKLIEIFKNLKNNSFQLYAQGTDKYGRILGYLKHGTVDINKKMVESGYAWCYRFTQCPKSYQTAMENAQRLRKGLFVEKNPTTPWDWRKDNQRNKRNKRN